jgi:uncharacterized Tic20 family protein
MTDPTTPAQPDPDPAAGTGTGGATPPPPPPQQPPQQPQYAQPPSAPSGGPLTQEQDVQWASFAHLGGILGFIPSLVIWLVFKDRGQFTDVEAKEALNFQITLTGAYIILSVLVAIITVATFGFGGFLTFLLWVPWLVSLIFSIIAFLQVKEGRHYRYPFAVRLIK